MDWLPWGEEAFRRAREEDKPILLDVGAVWCHWCHVMDRESYENPELAATLNRRFVCVKVDRDERPDVDARYQGAVQALTGQGGWPLTAFLTPEGDVFFGGTYFPPDDRFGRESFGTILRRVDEVFRARREQVAASGGELKAHVARLLAGAAAGEPAPELLERGARQMDRLFDERHGGFGASPKFPHPAAIEFLLARWWDTGDARLREMVERTLTGMADGGVRDQLGGGFHRYATDERWIVPHFEKMSYDNAELLKAYVHAYAALRIPLWREAAEGIAAWCLEILADPGRGGFGASQDADVGLEDDGDYFTWTQAEARAALTGDEWEVARRRWDIGEAGEMRHDPARNVLWVARDAAAIAAELGLDPPRVEELLRGARAKLKAARDRRAPPAVDRAVYTGWNAMLAEAFLEAGAVLARPDLSAFALRTLERLWRDAPGSGGLLRHRADAPAVATGGAAAAAEDQAGPFFLDDQVQAASAALAASEHTGDARWLERSRDLMARTLERFAADGGGLVDAVAGAPRGLLDQPALPIQDAPTPAANAVAALVLLRHAAITEDPSWTERAGRLLQVFAGSAEQSGLFTATYLRAVDWLLNGACRIVVADATTSPTLRATALAAYRPRKVVVPSATSPVGGVAPPVALVCAGTACAAPVRDAAALLGTIQAFGRRPARVRIV